MPTPAASVSRAEADKGAPPLPWQLRVVHDGQDNPTWLDGTPRPPPPSNDQVWNASLQRPYSNQDGLSRPLGDRARLPVGSSGSYCCGNNTRRAALGVSMRRWKLVHERQCQYDKEGRDPGPAESCSPLASSVLSAPAARELQIRVRVHMYL